MTSDARVIVEIQDGIATITMDNTAKRNAITVAMAEALIDICRSISDDPTVGAVIIRGAGGYFCSGADTSVLSAAAGNPASDEAVSALSTIYSAFMAVEQLSVPSLAVVEGGAVGAGLNLALSADLLLVTPESRLDSGFVARGIHPGGGHLTLLLRRVGVQGALALAGLGQALVGDEAVRRGLAWECVTAEDALHRAAELLAHPAADPSLARVVKRSLRSEADGLSASLGSAVDIERGAQMWSLARRAPQREWRSGTTAPRER